MRAADYRQAALGLMTERQLQDRIIEAATRGGWRHYHTHDSRRSDPGWPDIVLVRGRRMLVLELKRRTGRVSVHQRGWIDALQQVDTLDVRVVRPDDLDDLRDELLEDGS